jgi:Holliday junction resolvase RusA-like endonuclease
MDALNGLVYIDDYQVRAKRSGISISQANPRVEIEIEELPGWDGAEWYTGGGSWAE